MATWKADIKTTSTGSIYSVTVEAGASYVAKQEIERLYNPIFIRNLHQVRNSSSSSSSNDDGNGGVALIGLAAAAWAFFTFTPIIAMIGLGAVTTWISQIIVGQTVEEYTQRDDDSGHGRAAIVLALALLAGGFGFVKGTELQKQWNTPDVPSQIQTK